MPRVAMLLSAGLAVAAALHLDLSDREWKERPVAKIVGLLKDMQAQLEDEKKNDAELYDKLVCWCTTNDKEKTKAIKNENQQIADLTAAIEEYTSRDGQLTTQIATLKSAIAKGNKALEEAAQVRAKQLAEFNQDEKDMIQSIGSLKGAVTSLSKHNPSALLQRDAVVEVSKAIRQTMKTQPSLVKDAVKPHQRRRLAELLERPDTMLSLLQQPMDASGATSYNSQSGEIFGMLKQMKETFETNLDTSKTQEAASVKAFGELQAAKTAELKAATEKQTQAEIELGTTKESNARAKEDLENTEDALAADTDFLANLKKQCATIDNDWAARSKMRDEEITSVSETIAILTEDEAHDQLAKGTTLIQLRARVGREAVLRAEAVKFLRDAGDKLNSRKIAYLATRMKFDPFGKMRENIDTMVGALDKEKQDEVVYKDNCVSDLNTNDKETNEKHEIKNDLETEINRLNTEEAELTDEEKRLIQEVADMQLEMKKASENREKENKDYQQVVADQRATRAILQKALDRLGEFYNRKQALLQTSQAKVAQRVPGEASSPMPAGFETYQKAGGGGAMAMVQQIIADSKATEADATTAELDAQSGYEAFVQDTNKAIKVNRMGITTDEENIAQNKVEESQDESDKKHTITEILTLGDMNKSIHGACDFTLNNFDARQHSRDEETEALKQAKAIFSGAGFGR